MNLTTDPDEFVLVAVPVGRVYEIWKLPDEGLPEARGEAVTMREAEAMCREQFGPGTEVEGVLLRRQRNHRWAAASS